VKYSLTTTLEKTQALFYDDDYRIIVEQGGTSAGKTISILWILLDYALTHAGKVISIVSDTFPNLRKGAMRDFLNICRETNVLEIGVWNKSESTLTLPNGTIIEFFSTDMMGALGGRRDILYVNEANRISWETFSQLEVRTRDKVIIDFNPVNEFWAHTELLRSGRKDVAFLLVTYVDNEALEEATVKAIEMRRGDGTSNWWRVYGLGEIGSLEGNVYEGWKPVDAAEIAKQGRLVRYGLDFGYEGDETALVAVYEMSDGTVEITDQSEDIQAVEAAAKRKGLGLVELVYQKYILGSQYPEILKSHNIDPSVLIVADGARPEIIAEIRNAGYRIIAANKNAGSVKRGIDRVKEHEIRYSGKNLEREFLTYAWRKKKSTGETIYEPQDGNDHCMDALRYAIDDLSEPIPEYAGVRF